MEDTSNYPKVTLSHPSNQNTLTGPKGGQIRGSFHYLPYGLHLKVLDRDLLEELCDVLVGSYETVQLHQQQRHLSIAAFDSLKQENGFPQYPDNSSDRVWGESGRKNFKSTPNKEIQCNPATL